MAELLAGVPALPGSRCKGRADLFERCVAEHGRTQYEAHHARTAALRLCAECPALDPCRSWFNGLRPAQRPRGVVAGQIVRADGRITRAALAAIDERRTVVEDQDDNEPTAGRRRTRRAALVCHRASESEPHNAEWTYWSTIDEARQAEEALTPCGPRCLRIHTVVRVDRIDS
ncbi:hypothetical protein ABQF35_28630 [Mycobacterium syngnathidarum]